MEKTKSKNDKSTGNQGALRDNGEGLLWRFIMEKLHSYTPPTRKGTPRGETVGYPRVKYLAVLLVALMGATLREIAEDEELNVSYELLRKWATESEFKELGLKFREEFTERFIQQMRAHYEENNRRWNENGDGEVEKVISNPDTDERRQKDLEEFGLQDNRLYSPDLLTDIYSRIKPEISEGGTSATFFWLNVVNMLLSSSHRRSHYPLRRLNYAILRCLSITHLQQAKSILRSREKTTSQDSQSAIRLLDQVQRFLEWQAIN